MIEQQRISMRDYLAAVEYHGSMTVHKDSYAAVYLEALAKYGKVTASPAKKAGEGYITYRLSEGGE